MADAATTHDSQWRSTRSICLGHVVTFALDAPREMAAILSHSNLSGSRAFSHHKTKNLAQMTREQATSSVAAR